MARTATRPAGGRPGGERDRGYRGGAPVTPAHLRDFGWSYGGPSIVTAEQQRKLDRNSHVIIINPPGSYRERQLEDLHGLERRAVAEAQKTLAALYPKEAKERNVVVVNGAEIMMVSGATVTATGEIVMAMGEEVLRRWPRKTKEVPGTAKIAKIVLSDHQRSALFEPDEVKVRVVPRRGSTGDRVSAPLGDLGRVVTEAMINGLQVNYSHRKVEPTGNGNGKTQDLYTLRVGASARNDEMKVRNTEAAMQLGINGILGNPATLVLGETGYVEIGDGHDVGKFRFATVTTEEQLSYLKVETRVTTLPRPGGPAARRPTADGSRSGSAPTGDRSRETVRSGRIESGAEATEVRPIIITVGSDRLRDMVMQLTLRQVAQGLGLPDIETLGLGVEVARPGRRDLTTVRENTDRAADVEHAWHEQSLITSKIRSGKMEVGTLIKQKDPTNLVFALELAGTRSVKRKDAVTDIASANRRVIEIRQEIAKRITEARGAKTANQVAQEYLTLGYRGGNRELVTALADLMGPKTPQERAFDLLPTLIQGLKPTEARVAVDAIAAALGLTREEALLHLDKIRHETRGGRRRPGSYTVDSARVLLTIPDDAHAEGGHLIPDREWAEMLLKMEGYPEDVIRRSLSTLYDSPRVPTSIIRAHGAGGGPRRQGYEDR